MILHYSIFSHALLCIMNSHIIFQAFYSNKFGKDNIILIRDGQAVKADELQPEKAYIQITYVEPYFDSYDLKERKTAFERNFNISK